MGMVEEKYKLNNNFFEQNQNDTLTFSGINIFLNTVRITDPSKLVFGEGEIIFSDFYDKVILELNTLKQDSENILELVNNNVSVNSFNQFKLENEIINKTKISSINPIISNSLSISGETSILNIGDTTIIDVNGELTINSRKFLLGENEILDKSNWSQYIHIPNNYIFTDRNTEVSANIYFNSGYGIVLGNNNIKISSDGQNSYVDLNDGNLIFRDGLVNKITINRSTGNAIFNGDIIVKNNITTSKILIDSIQERPFEIVGKNKKETTLGIGNKAGGGASLILDGVNGNFTGNDYMLIGQDNSLRGRIEMISQTHVIDMRIAGVNIATFTSSDLSINKNTNLRGSIKFFEVDSKTQDTIYKSKTKYLNIHGSENGVMFLDYFGDQAIMYNREMITLNKNINIEGSVNFGVNGDYRFNFSGGDKLAGYYNKFGNLILDISTEKVNIYSEFNVKNLTIFDKKTIFNDSILIKGENLEYEVNSKFSHIFKNNDITSEFSWNTQSGFYFDDNISLHGDIDIFGKVNINGNSLTFNANNNNWSFYFNNNGTLIKNSVEILHIDESILRVPIGLESNFLSTNSIFIKNLKINEDLIEKEGNLNIFTSENINFIGNNLTFNNNEIYHKGNLKNIPNLETENVFKGKQTFIGDILLKDFGNAIFTINGTSGSFLNMFSSNGGHISYEAQNLDQGTIIKKIAKNTNNNMFLNYSECWFDGENEIKVESKNNSIIITTNEGIYDIKEMANTINILQEEINNLKNT